MKVTVLNDKKSSRPYSSLVSSLFLLFLGIVLVFNSDGLISIIFTIVGALVILYGVSKFFRFYQLKNQLHVEQPEILISAITITFAGILLVLLSSILVNAIKIVTGIWLFLTGISKMNQAIYFKTQNQKRFITEVIAACVILLLGIYTIFAQNVLFVFLGIILILYSAVDIARYFWLNKEN